MTPKLILFRPLTAECQTAKNGWLQVLRAPDCQLLPRLRLRRHHRATPSSHFYYRQIGRRPTSELLAIRRIANSSIAINRSCNQMLTSLHRSPSCFFGLWKQFPPILHLYNTSFCTSCSRHKNLWRKCSKLFCEKFVRFGRDLTVLSPNV